MPKGLLLKCLLTANLQIFGVLSEAQKIDFPTGFFALLDSAGLEFFEPLEAGYRDIYSPQNKYQDCHLAIRSSREDLEIRYMIKSWNENDPLASLPNVEAFRAVTNVASNAENALISAIQPESEQLLRDFNADWGMIYFFEPKKEFSDWPYCRMLALHKKEKGTALVFFFFDDPGNPALDTRYLALRFIN